MCEGWRAFPTSARGPAWSLILAGVAVAGVVHSGARAAERSAPCRLTAPTPAAVAAVVDERTLRLLDGREVRLAGLVSLADAGNAKVAEANAARARTALERLVRGNTVVVQDLGEDRYGRRIALAAMAGSQSGPTLQERLIATGNGLVAARIEHPGCAGRFLEAERVARGGRVGVWADPHYLIHVHEARAYTALAALRGRFVLVEGVVLSVNDRGATVYVNFGRRWSEDFTVTIAKRNMRNFTAARFDPQTLAGRRVRIRGWIDERGGPWIEAIRPEQIEIADGKH